MVVYRINETLQTGAVTNRTYRAGETVYLFLKFTIVVEKGEILVRVLVIV